MKYMVLILTMMISTMALAVEADVSALDFLSQVFSVVKSLGGMAWGLKIASIMFLVVGSMKVSLIRSFTWDKIPAALKVWLAPFLSALAGLFSSGNFDKASLTAWALAGGGAVLLYQILEGVKLIPGIGPKYVSIINFIGVLLGKPKA